MKQKNSLKWVVDAHILEAHKLHLTFNDGSCRVFDCLPLIDKYQIFAPLRDKDVFAQFSLDGWTVNWLGGTIDIAPEYLYDVGKVA